MNPVTCSKLEQAIILAIECSAKSVSAAIGIGSSILAETNLNTKTTHSQTLLPLVHYLLDCSGVALRDIGCFAVTTGPGSFTGLRIGIGAVKGLAYGLDKPCIGVSTLDAIAAGLPGVDGIVCAAMDARCGQVYTALYDSSPAGRTRLTEDLALSLQDLKKTLSDYPKNIFFVGDGAVLCYNNMADDLSSCYLAAENVRRQRASGVLMSAYSKLQQGITIDAAALSPDYLRLPQAERERQARINVSPNTR